ncbi:Protein of unknown function [Gryllus bimaculatus]|nr:Protein of unknown function [Gryllus bimaculatus]
MRADSPRLLASVKIACSVDIIFGVLAPWRFSSRSRPNVTFIEQLSQRRRGGNSAGLRALRVEKPVMAQIAAAPDRPVDLPATKASGGGPFDEGLPRPVEDRLLMESRSGVEWRSTLDAPWRARHEVLTDENRQGASTPKIISTEHAILTKQEAWGCQRA